MIARSRGLERLSRRGLASSSAVLSDQVGAISRM